MKTIKLVFNFCGQDIEASFNLIDNINAMPEALKIETILDVLECLTGNEQLEDFQKAIFKDKLNKLKCLYTSLTLK